MTDHAQTLASKIEDHSALVGIIGLGYVGLPLALAFTENGFNVLGFDVDPIKVNKINSGDCYIKHLDPSRLARAIAGGDVESQAGVDGKSEIRNPKSEIPNSSFLIPNSELTTSEARLEATTDFARLTDADAILICVPTPLGPHREPDMSYVESSTRAVQETLRPGQLVVLESTTYPGTTDDLLKPILEAPCHPERATRVEGPPEAQSESEISSGANGKSEISSGAGGKSEIRNPKSEISSGAGDGKSEIRNPKSEILECGTHFFLAFSPEREDPGNKSYGTTNTPKLVGGVDTISGDLAQALYDQVVSQTVRVA